MGALTVDHVRRLVAYSVATSHDVSAQFDAHCSHEELGGRYLELADLVVNVAAERDRYAAALDAILAMEHIDELSSTVNFERAQKIARKAREGTGQ